MKCFRIAAQIVYFQMLYSRGTNRMRYFCWFTQIAETEFICPYWAKLHKQRPYIFMTLLEFVVFRVCQCNRHQTILQTFLNFFLNLTLPGVSHLYKQLPNGQYLSDFCKMCNLDAHLWKRWIGDHRILTYIFKWERLNTAGHSHSEAVSIGHWVAPLHNG